MYRVDKPLLECGSSGCWFTHIKIAPHAVAFIETMDLDGNE
jgi:hypothetical protein